MSTATITAAHTHYPDFAESGNRSGSASTSASLGSAIDRLMASFEAEREIHAEEIARLNTEITRLSGDRAVLIADRNRLNAAISNLRNQAESDARNWRLLREHVSGPLADHFADEIGGVRLETYQDDGSGRYAVSVDQDEIGVDMTGEDFVPEIVVFTKTLPDGTEAKFRAKLRATELRYDVEYVG